MRAALSLVSLVSVAACLSKAPADDPVADAPRQTKSRLAVEPITPEPVQKVDLSLGSNELRRPIRDGRLTLFPIVAGARSSQNYTTLADGMDKGLVVVSEHDDVHSVAVWNHSRDPLLILGGELILDGHQDRVIQHDTTIAPGQLQTVSVWCVERGRYEGQPRFHASHAMAEYGLRQIVKHDDDQSAVWNKVDQINLREGISVPTDTYRHAARKLMSSENNLERRGYLGAQLSNLEESDRIVGFAVALDDRMIGIEELATPELFRKLEPMLLASYLPATLAKVHPSERPVGPADVRDYAAAINAAGPLPRRSPGATATTD